MKILKKVLLLIFAIFIILETMLNIGIINAGEELHIVTDDGNLNNMKIGDTYKLYLKGNTPNYSGTYITYVWSSSNSSVVKTTQDATGTCTINALSEGSATISVTKTWATRSGVTGAATRTATVIVASNETNGLTEGEATVVENFMESHLGTGSNCVELNGHNPKDVIEKIVQRRITQRGL